ncbi:MAG: hypothetical protein ACTSRI_15725 [Promethearchaeota archaeon]
MELFQVNWDDKMNLFFEFKKNKEEKCAFIPETVKSVNLRFEIIKIARRESYHKQMPSLISIKNLYFSEETILFSINLDELSDPDDLEIKIIHLTIILYSGRREEIPIDEKFKISEICFNEDYYTDFIKNDSKINSQTKNSITQERIYHEKTIDREKNKEKSTYIYEKNKIVNDTYNDSNKDQMMSMIYESNERLKKVEQELKNLNLSLKQKSFNDINYMPSSPIIKRKQVPGFERIKKTPRKANKSSQKILFLKELKAIIKTNTMDNKQFNFRDILKPMSEIEFKKITLNNEELEKIEEIAINNEIKRTKKTQVEILCLENLKKPKI